MGLSNFTHLAYRHPDSYMPPGLGGWGHGFLFRVPAAVSPRHPHLSVCRPGGGAKLRTTVVARVALSGLCGCSKSQFGEHTLGLLLRVNKRTHVDDNQKREFSSTSSLSRTPVPLVRCAVVSRTAPALSPVSFPGSVWGPGKGSVT